MKTELTLFSSQPISLPAQSYTLLGLATISLQRILVLTMVAFAASLQPHSSTADEPMAKFVEALRDRGYFSEAIDYLVQIDKATLSAESLERLPFEQSSTYRQAAAASRDLRLADTMLSEAQTAINNYQPRDDNDLVAFQTAQFRGDLLLSRARVNLARMSGERISQTQRTTLNEQTRSFLSSSRDEYQTATKKLALALKSFQVDPDDSSTANELTRMRAQYTYLKTRSPMLGQLLANTWDGGSQQRKDLLQQAATDAKTVWTKYQNYQPALDACLTAARCFQDLDQFDQSQQLVNEIFSRPRSDISSDVRREASFIAVNNWQATTPYPWDAVVTELEPLVKLLTPDQAKHPQWQAAQLALARGLKAQADSLSGDTGSAAKRQAKDASSAAIKLAQALAQTRGEAREQAISLLKEWDATSVAALPTASDTLSPATTFAEAETRGKALIREIDSRSREISAATQQVRTASTPANKQEAQAAMNQLRQQQLAQSDVALKSFNDAIRLADDSVTRPQVNYVRYLQSYCYFVRQQYIESSVIAEFLLDKYPNVAGTRQAASILLRNYAALLNQATDDKTFEREQLVRACKLILERFPDTSEASNAAARLAQLSLTDGDFDQAQTWFEKIPAGDGQRATLALSLGRRLWFDWSKSQSAGTTENDQQLVVAKQYLNEGVASSSLKTLTYGAAEGALLLAEALLASGDVDAAIKRLESEEIAPLKLIEQSSPVLAAAGRADLYHQEAAMTAIKAYMSAMGNSTNGQQEWIDKAGQVIATLQARLKSSGSADASKRLTTIYRLISQRLLEQFDSLAAGQSRASFAVSLASFLGAIEEQSDDARTVVWAGSTLLSVASTLKQDGATEQAEPIFAKAVSALDRAESLGFGIGKDAATMARELKRQRALAQRGAGKFDAALKQFTQLLTENAGDLTSQLNAAMTLQQQAAAEQNPKGFAKAILGTSPVANPKTKRSQNAIWGWRKLVTATRGKERFADAFHQSLYHMIEARYEMGRINQSTDGIQKALAELNNWQKRNPDFDNGPWKSKFEQLKQRIQKQ